MLFRSGIIKKIWSKYLPGGLGRARERKRGPMLTNLFSLKELQTGEIKRLLEDAQAFRDGGKNPAGIPDCIAEAAKVLEGQLG